MYLGVGDHLWVDAWIPRDDALWSHDVSVAAEWVGQWWIEAFAAVGIGARIATERALWVHTGRSVPGPLGDLVCFAGRGPGEVFYGDRKIVGLSQWRSREGALFSSCAYLEWEPEPLLDLLSFDDATRSDLAGALRDVAVGVGALLASAVDELAGVCERLVGAFPRIGLEGT